MTYMLCRSTAGWIVVSVFIFYVNDTEQQYETNGYEGVKIEMLKLFFLLHADDNVIMSESENGLQNGLDLLDSIVWDGD